MSVRSRPSACKPATVACAGGVAHEYLMPAPETEAVDKMTNCYAPDHDRGLAPFDPDLGIVWDRAPAMPILSDKNHRVPALRAGDSLFAGETSP